MFLSLLQASKTYLSRVFIISIIIVCWEDDVSIVFTGLFGWHQASNWECFLCWQLQPGAELQYGRVSAAELVQAVDEMLSAVGIHMDVEKQSLLGKTVMLQEQLKESQTMLLLEQVSVISRQNVSNLLMQFLWWKRVNIDCTSSFWKHA